MHWRRWRVRAVVVQRRIRDRHRWLDHLVRAVARYQHVDGRRLAAAVSFYAFFAVFALGLLGFAVLGFVLHEPEVNGSVQRFFDENLPRMDTSALREARNAVGLLALVSLPVIGLLWVDSLRSSLRAIWGVEQYPGRFLTRWSVDLLVLMVLGAVLTVSFTIAFGAEAVLERITTAAGAGDLAATRWLLGGTRFTLGLAVNTLLSIVVLTALPRLKVPLRRVLAPALLIAGGLELLTSSGRLVVGRAEANPAFQVVAGAAGLLVFLLIVNQLILFAAALAATGGPGRVTDLATGRQVGDELPPSPPEPRSPEPDPPQPARPGPPPVP